MSATQAGSRSRGMMFLVPKESGAGTAGAVRPGGGAVDVISSDHEPEEAAVAADLVRRIVAGETDAEEDLVARYRRGLLYLLSHRGALPDLADDLVQETFRIVIERLRHSGLTDPAGLRPFLRGTACNLLEGRGAQGGPAADLGGLGRAGAGRGSGPERAPGLARRREGQDGAAPDRRAPHRPRPRAPDALLCPRGRQGDDLRRPRPLGPALQPRPPPGAPAFQGAMERSQRFQK